MAKSESEIKIILNDKEKVDLKNAVKKLTENKIGFSSSNLTEDETKIIDFIKEDL